VEVDQLSHQSQKRDSRRGGDVSDGALILAYYPIAHRLCAVVYVVDDHSHLHSRPPFLAFRETAHAMDHAELGRIGLSSRFVVLGNRAELYHLHDR
jgi:hypothetical protein